MELLILSLQASVNAATLVAILYSLWRMLEITRESRAARSLAVAATLRAEESAREAAAHALDTSVKVAAMVENVNKIELATNSMKDALVAATATASHLEGREEQRLETEAKAKEGS